jgi:phage FluMu protein Com
MDLRQVRAIVTDRKVLSSLDPAVVSRYLREKGWAVRGQRRTGTVWSRQAGDREVVIFLPCDRGFGDFTLRMSEVLCKLAKVEDRSQFAILVDQLEHGEVRCPECGSELPVKVLRSAAGYYLGRWCPRCGPYERVSVSYYPSRPAAEAALASGEYDSRVYAVENQEVRG